MLGAHGAPTEFISKDARLIHPFRREHPFLIVAACLYLRPRAWRLGNAELNAIVGPSTPTRLTRMSSGVFERRSRRGHPKAPLPPVAYRRTIRDQARRRARRRQSADRTGQGAASRPRRSLGGAAPRWPLRSLTAPRPDGSKTSSGSPAEELPPEDRSRAHLRGEMNQHGALRAISHFTLAQRNSTRRDAPRDMLAVASRETRPLPDDAIFRVWANEPLPGGMDLDIKLLVRGAQLAAFRELGRSLEYRSTTLSSSIAMSAKNTDLAFREPRLRGIGGKPGGNAQALHGRPNLSLAPQPHRPEREARSEVPRPGFP